MLALNTQLTRNQYCKDCDLYKSCQTVCLWGHMTATTPQIVLIGEAPGETEDRLMVPFVGRAGKVLEAIYTEKGFSRADFYITNAVKCRPFQNALPSEAQIKACKKYLISEINELQPKLIVTLGKVAYYSLFPELPKNSIISARMFGPARYKGIRIIPTYHPAATFHNPAILRSIEETFSQIKGVLNAEKNMHSSSVK